MLWRQRSILWSPRDDVRISGLSQGPALAPFSFRQPGTGHWPQSWPRPRVTEDLCANYLADRRAVQISVWPCRPLIGQCLPRQCYDWLNGWWESQLISRVTRPAAPPCCVRIKFMIFKELATCVPSAVHPAGRETREWHCPGVHVRPGTGAPRSGGKCRVLDLYSGVRALVQGWPGQAGTD